MEIKPIRDFVAVTKNEAPKQTSSGLFVASTAEESVVRGTVVAVGSGHLSDDGKVLPLEVQVGDTVVFDKDASVEIRAEDTPYLLVREKNIVCCVKG